MTDTIPATAVAFKVTIERTGSPGKVGFDLWCAEEFLADPGEVAAEWIGDHVGTELAREPFLNWVKTGVRDDSLA